MLGPCLPLSRDDILRILVSTDNHLGVWERDEVRGADSFRSLEEVLALARREKVDLVLLGGDLFHDNKPSRQTVIRAMEIFSKACLSDQPVRFQILSDQRQNFSSGCVGGREALLFGLRRGSSDGWLVVLNCRELVAV